jgi:hypothetical protein
MLRAGEIAAPRQAGKSRALAAGAGPAAKRTVPAPGLRARTTGAAMSSGRRLIGLLLDKTNLLSTHGDKSARYPLNP